MAKRKEGAGGQVPPHDEQTGNLNADITLKFIRLQPKQFQLYA